MFLLHAHALCYVLCCGVHTILLIKCPFRCFCVYFWTPLSTKFGDNHVSMFGTTNDYVFSHFALCMLSCLICTLFHMMHTQTKSLTCCMSNAIIISCFDV